MTDSAAMPIVEARGVEMTFGQTRALRGVDLTLRSGEVHGLVGPNGSGKSTLIKVLAGVNVTKRGSVLVDGKPLVAGGDPALGFIHQNLGLVNELSIRDNIRLTLGSTKNFGFLIDHRTERDTTKRALSRVALDIDPDRTIAELTLGERTLVAAARLMELGARVLVVDEATAALSKKDSDLFYGHLAEAAAAGAAIVIVSHRLAEIVEQCDVVTCLRDGEVTYSGPTPSVVELHHLIAGREAGETPEPIESDIGRTILEAKSAGHSPSVGQKVSSVDLKLTAGEAVGIIGPLSSGLYEVARLLSGQLDATEGEVVIHDRENGDEGVVALLPEDRHDQGLFSEHEVDTNMTFGALKSFTGMAGFLKRRVAAGAVREKIDALELKPPDPKAIVHTLSGGNQQKVLVGRVALLEPDVYVLCEPSRGVDVGAREAIHAFIRSERRRGAAVVVVTTDADEALATCDRIAAIENGVMGEVKDRSEISLNEVLQEV